MEDQLISFEIAKLAKDKGFDIVQELVYNSLNQIEKYNRTRWTLYRDYCFAPTQSLLQKWLREVHGIYIELLVDGWEKNLCFRLFIYQKGEPSPKPHDDYGALDNYEEALKFGLIQALKLIKE